jgi:hypothetical protein
MKILDTVESKEILPRLFTPSRRLLGVDPVGEPTENALGPRRSPMNLYASALSDDDQQLLGCFSVTITTDTYYRDLLAGKVFENSFAPWDERDPPVLFLRYLVINDRRCVPYLFRLLLRDFHRTCDIYDVYIHRAYAISPHWGMQRILHTYNFEPVGLYRGKYPIVMASRDSSMLLNSYLKKYPTSER